MVVVKKKKGESVDSLISRFKKMVMNSGIIEEARDRQHHKTDAEKRKEKRKRVQHQIELEKKRQR